MAVSVPQEARDQNRVYDKDHKDYHNWDDNENRAWGAVPYGKPQETSGNFRRRTRRSSRNTGIGATPIQIRTGKGGTRVRQHRRDELLNDYGLQRCELPSCTNQANGVVTACRFHLSHYSAHMILYCELR